MEGERERLRDVDRQIVVEKVFAVNERDVFDWGAGRFDVLDNHMEDRLDSGGRFPVDVAGFVAFWGIKKEQKKLLRPLKQ
jgi:hypothetical protein